MLIFAAVCLGLITLELGIIALFLIVAALRLGRATKAVEDLSHHIDDQVSQSSSVLRSGLLSFVQTFASVAAGWLSGRRRKQS